MPSHKPGSYPMFLEHASILNFLKEKLVSGIVSETAGGPHTRYQIRTGRRETRCRGHGHGELGPVTAALCKPKCITPDPKDVLCHFSPIDTAKPHITA